MDTNNTFDPASIGAKPYSADSFDPTTIGAKPYSPDMSQQDINTSAAVLGQSNSWLGANGRDSTGAVPADQMASLKESDQQSKEVADKAQSPLGIINNALPDVGPDGPATVGGTVGGIFNNIGKGIKSAVRSPIDIVRGLFGLNPYTNAQEQADPSQQTFQSDFANKTVPAVMNDETTPAQATIGTVGDVVGSLAPLLGIEGGEAGTKALEGTETGANISDKLDNAASTVKQAVSPTLTPEQATGQIIQGETGDIPAAQRTLSSIDTTRVKTYKDLSNSLGSQIKPLAKEVDAELGKNTTGMSIKSFGQDIGEGKSAVNVNYVKQGISDLRNFYAKTNDAVGLSKMNALENKAKINGLTYKDINDLARLHGSEINAFNANGEAASGLSKQAAENTRKGLKAIARQGLGGDAARALDSKLTDLYNTKSLVDDQVEKVNKVAQRNQPQGIIPKLIGKGVKLADTITGGPLKAIGKEIGFGGSTPMLSPTEIEGSLAKNLKIISGK